MDRYMRESFSEESAKIATLPVGLLSRMGAGLMGLGRAAVANPTAAGAVLGAGTGAVGGAVAGGPGNRLRGAALGAAGGAAGGALLGRSNFGKRQVHGLTGAFANTAEEAAAIGLDATAHAQGISSIPGIARGLANSSTRATTAKNLGSFMLHGGAPGGSMGQRAFNYTMAGLPLAMAAPGLMRGDESATGGQTRTQKVVNLGLNTAGSVLTAGMPIVPQIMGSMGVGALAEKITRPRTPQPNLPPQPPQPPTGGMG